MLAFTTIFTSTRLRAGFAVLCLLALGTLMAGCHVPGTPDAVVGNQGTKDPYDTGATIDRSGHVVANPSTGAGDRKGLGN